MGSGSAPGDALSALSSLIFMMTLTATLILILSPVGHASAQSQRSCEQYDDRTKLASRHHGVLYYIEVCKRPNPEGKPALSLVFTSIDGNDAMRIYSSEAGTPLILDGIYVERNGEKRFILHGTEIEWANGSRTSLDSIDAKKKKKLVAVLDAASELLKWAAENRRVLRRNSQDYATVGLVMDFMFDYKLNGKH